MIIADTGFFFALASQSDRYHSAAIRAFNALTEPLITTYPVLTETCYLLSSIGGNMAQCKFLDDVATGAAQVFDIEIHHLLRMSELMAIYGDLPMDMADASLVVVAEQLGDGRILTSDRRDFSVYRWRNTRPFENLLLNYM